MIDLRSHFQREHRRHAEWLRNQCWFQKAKEKQTRKDKMADESAEDLDVLSAGLTMATNAEIEAFETKLDRYDEATVKALMDNQENLDAVNIRLMDLLSRAYVMEDGRRVFKTIDGSKVFDEFGQAVSADELDFDAITPDMPTWEEFEPDFEERQRLEAERRQLLEFQEKVDQAREKIGEGAISKDELEKLDFDLKEAEPTSIELSFKDIDLTDCPQSLKSAFTASSTQPFAGTQASLTPTNW